MFSAPSVLACIASISVSTAFCGSFCLEYANVRHLAVGARRVRGRGKNCRQLSYDETRGTTWLGETLMRINKCGVSGFFQARVAGDLVQLDRLIEAFSIGCYDSFHSTY